MWKLLQISGEYVKLEGTNTACLALPELKMIPFEKASYCVIQCCDIYRHNSPSLIPRASEKCSFSTRLLSHLNTNTSPCERIRANVQCKIVKVRKSLVGWGSKVFRVSGCKLPPLKQIHFFCLYTYNPLFHLS